MKGKPLIAAALVLALIGAAAGILHHAKSGQRLGEPGVKTRPLPGSRNLEVLLPDKLPGYKSEWVPQSPIVTNQLPPDTSFGQRLYTGDDGFQVLINVVLMGGDRTSIHKPEICLAARGYPASCAALNHHVRTGLCHRTESFVSAKRLGARQAGALLR